VLSKADTHFHTRYSGFGHYKSITFPESVTHPEAAVDAARKEGLRVLCVTDHDAVRGALRAREYARRFDDIEIVVGSEITAREGEIIGLFMEESVPKGLPIEETIERIRAQGGLTVAPHPFSKHVPALGELVETLDLDGLEILNGGHVDGYANQAAADRSGNGRWAVLGGSDAHTLSQLGCCYTTFPGETAEDLRKAILNRTTATEGSVSTLEMGVKWTVEVVLNTDLLIMRSLFHKVSSADPEDPLIKKVNIMRAENKLAALFSSAIFLTPPIPFLTGVTGVRVMKIMNHPHRFDPMARPDQ